MEPLKQVHTFRTDQNSRTFPWSKFKSPWQYQSQKFMNLARKVHWDQTSYLQTAEIKHFLTFPWYFLQHFIPSQTYHRISWQFPDLEKNLISLTFPWRVRTLLNTEIDRPKQTVQTNTRFCNVFVEQLDKATDKGLFQMKITNIFLISPWNISCGIH